MSAHIDDMDNLTSMWADDWDEHLTARYDADIESMTKAVGEPTGRDDTFTGEVRVDSSQGARGSMRLGSPGFENLCQRARIVLRAMRLPFDPTFQQDGNMTAWTIRLYRPTGWIMRDGWHGRGGKLAYTISSMNTMFYTGRPVERTGYELHPRNDAPSPGRVIEALTEDVRSLNAYLGNDPFPHRTFGEDMGLANESDMIGLWERMAQNRTRYLSFMGELANAAMLIAEEEY